MAKGGRGLDPVPGRPVRALPRYGTVTPCNWTGPRVGSSSVAWETPAGVIVSMSCGTVPGSSEQIGEVPPGAHTPKEYPPAVAVNALAWSPE